MRRRVVWHGLAAVFILSAGLVASDLADAAPGSRVCRDIESQLANSGGSQSSRWSAAADRQRSEIAKVRRQMRASGCGFFSTGGQCRSLSAASARMERNLSALQRGTSRRGGTGRSRTQLLAALQANDCRGERRVVARQPSRFDRILGISPRSDSSYLAYAEENPDTIGRSNVRRPRQDRTPGFDGSRFRTFCVRSCDGYYFPMSPASSRSDFARDAQNCQTACPGAEMQVYYHSGDQEDAADMTSAATGKPYSEMATAFLYRSDASPANNSCSCAVQPPQSSGYKVVAGETSKSQPETVTVTAVAEPSGPTLPLPKRRPDPASDPETLLNREGGFDAEAVGRLLSGKHDVAGAERKVRVVGPKFLPDPAVAAARPAQDRTEVQ